MQARRKNSSNDLWRLPEQGGYTIDLAKLSLLRRLFLQKFNASFWGNLIHCAKSSDKGDGGLMRTQVACPPVDWQVGSHVRSPSR